MNCGGKKRRKKKNASKKRAQLAKKGMKQKDPQKGLQEKEKSIERGARKKPKGRKKRRAHRL